MVVWRGSPAAGKHVPPSCAGGLPWLGRARFYGSHAHRGVGRGHAQKPGNLCGSRVISGRPSWPSCSKVPRIRACHRPAPAACQRHTVPATVPPSCAGGLPWREGVIQAPEREQRGTMSPRLAPGGLHGGRVLSKPQGASNGDRQSVSPNTRRLPGGPGRRSGRLRPRPARPSGGWADRGRAAGAS